MFSSIFLRFPPGKGVLLGWTVDGKLGKSQYFHKHPMVSDPLCSDKPRPSLSML